MKKITKLKLLCIALVTLVPSYGLASAEKPNIVLILMNNFAYGKLGSYGGGITRGAATARVR